MDEVGGAVVHLEGLPMNVSVDMSIAFLSKAKLGVSLLMFFQIFTSDCLLLNSYDLLKTYRKGET